MAKKGKGKPARSRKRKRPELTIESVQADPLAIVNADEEQLREFFGRLLDDAELVEAAVRFALAYRQVYEAATAEPYDPDAHCDAVNDGLAPFWRKYDPGIRREPNLTWYEGSEKSPPELWYDLEESAPKTSGRRVKLWYCLMVSFDYAEHDSSFKGKVPVWEALWYRLAGGGALMLPPLAMADHSLLRCAHCGKIQERGRMGQKYCSKSCRVMASQVRKRQKKT